MYLIVLQSIDALDIFLESRNAALAKYKLRNTPFVIRCGQSPTNLDYYVRIDNIIYATYQNRKLTLIQAVDICFKAYIALRKDFAIECESTLFFLERYVYEIKNKNRKSSKGLSKLLSELNITEEDEEEEQEEQEPEGQGEEEEEEEDIDQP